MPLLAALQSAAVTFDTAPAWEVAKGVMLTLSTTALLFCGRLLFGLRDDVRDLKREFVGSDGTNGIKSHVRLLQQRVDVLEDRNIAIDAVAEAERHLHPGPDRRTGPRRMRDVVYEAQDERSRRLTEEYPAPPPED